MSLFDPLVQNQVGGANREIHHFLRCTRIVRNCLAADPAKKNHLLAKVAYLVLAAIPLLGPLIDLLIDPPEGTPPRVAAEEFWHPSKGTNVWPSFDPLVKSLRGLFRQPPEKNSSGNRLPRHGRLMRLDRALPALT